MYMPIYGIDISCNFQSSIEAPASSCPEWEVFFLLDENGKLLYSHRGKPQGLTLSKAQKYPMAKSSFCLFSLSLSLSLSFWGSEGASWKARPAPLNIISRD